MDEADAVNQEFTSKNTKEAVFKQAAYLFQFV
jgi:hypothetical protein